jgi:hypothetical protein
MYKECGIDPSSQYTRKPRTAQTVRQAILTRLSEGKEMSRPFVLADDHALLRAAERKYGSWSGAMRALGVPEEKSNARRIRRAREEERLIEQLMNRSKLGKEMNQAAVLKDEPRLVWSGKRLFGSWRNTLRASGLDADTLMLTRQAGYWNRDRIVQQIKDLYEDDGDLSSLHCQRNHSQLYSAACEYYNSWEKAVRAAGYDYDSVIKRHRAYTKPELLQWLRSRLDLGLPLNWTSVRMDNPTLAKTTREKFGTYRKAIEELRLDYNKVNLDRLRGRKQWTPSAVIDELKSYITHTQTLDNLSSANQPLYHACPKYFGSLKNAVTEAGFDYEELRSTQVWTDNKILSALKDYIQKYRTLDNIQKLDKALNSASVAYFGSLRKAVTQAGFDYESLLSRKFWTKDRIIANIRQLHSLGEDLSLSTAQTRHRPLVQAAIEKRYFGSWKKAVSASGFDYDKIRKNWFLETFKGDRFEEYVLKVLRILGRNVRHHRRFKFEYETCVPDFYDLDNGDWIDAKLNSWGPGVDWTTDRYLRYTNRITIIYLRGKTREWKDESVQFIPISALFRELDYRGAGNLIEDIKMLKQGILKPELQSQLFDFIAQTSPENKDEIARLLDFGPDMGE